jgi:hypothetical protein
VDYSRLDKETIAWAHDNARALLSEENERVRTIDGKAAQLAGFAGIILAVLGSVAPDAFDANLGQIGEVTLAVAFFLAAGALSASILWLVFKVMKPYRFVALDAKEIRNYLDDERLLRAEPWALQMRTLRVLAGVAQWAQDVVQSKADRLAEGVVLFGVGLGATLVAVVTIGVSNL